MTDATVTIRPDEMWCRNCGRVIIASRYARPQATDELERCCDHPDPVPAIVVLRPNEYLLRG